MLTLDRKSTRLNSSHVKRSRIIKDVNFVLQYSHFIKYLKYSFQSDGEITFFLTTL